MDSADAGTFLISLLLVASVALLLCSIGLIGLYFRHQVVLRESKTLRESYKSLEAKHEHLSRTSHAFLKEHERLKVQLREREEGKAALESTHQGLADEHERLQARPQESIAALKTLQADYERLKVYSQESVAALKTLRADYERLEARSQESVTAHETLQADYERLEAHLRERTEAQVALQATFKELMDEHGRLQSRFQESVSAYRSLHREREQFRERFRGVLNADAERATILSKLKAEHAQLQTLQTTLARLQEELRPLDEEANLQSFGFYQPHYAFASSTLYQAELESIRKLQKKAIQNKTATASYSDWAVNGNRAEGRKQVNQTLKLILRAFNGESDAAIAKVKYNNVRVMEARIRKAWETINGLVSVQRCEITSAYLDLKLQELFLAHEYQEKLQQEKEEQRRIREQMRDEENTRRELEKVTQEAEREERRYAEALRKAREEIERSEGARYQALESHITQLEQRLQEAHANKERVLARAQQTRSGHVYVISNVGSFGEDVFKIGMTRRLDPMDRIRELGDASVPFQFDVHAVIYSEDAPALEAALHRHFRERRINWINDRKEFFRTTIDEIAAIARQHCGEVEITHLAEAEEYRKTLAMLQAGQGSQAQ